MIFIFTVGYVLVLVFIKMHQNTFMTMDLQCLKHVNNDCNSWPRVPYVCICISDQQSVPSVDIFTHSRQNDYDLLVFN